MDTLIYTKYYNSAFLGSYCSFVMKDLVEKFIVLQIQTAPSRLQPASAQCFLTAMILPSAPSRIRAHAQHATLSTGQAWAFQNIGVPSRPQRKICDCNQKADT